MSLVLIIFLAVVQGLTEFLPVSSSGHLVVSRALLEPYLGVIESALAFDILIHLATALVTAAFLRKEILAICRNFFSKQGQRQRKLVALLLVATLPAVVVGFGFKENIEELFKAPTWALNGFLVTAIFLELAHRHQLRIGSNSIAEDTWPLPTFVQAALIGCAQALAIMPGVSRSGSTIAMALLLSLPARTATIFSFFMLLPVVAGAMLLEARELSGLGANGMLPFSIGFLVTMLTAYIALRFLVWVVEGAKLRWFAIYTAFIGIALRLLI